MHAKAHYQADGSPAALEHRRARESRAFAGSEILSSRRAGDTHQGQGSDEAVQTVPIAASLLLGVINPDLRPLRAPMGNSEVQARRFGYKERCPGAGRGRDFRDHLVTVRSLPPDDADSALTARNIEALARAVVPHVIRITRAFQPGRRVATKSR